MSLLKTMIKYTAEGDENSAAINELSSLPLQPPQPTIYVSTDLTFHQIEDARSYPTDSDIEGVSLHRLKPYYFAWLRSRMISAQAAYKAGKLSDQAWDTLRERFNRLQEMAIEMFGKETLQQALCDFNSKSYAPPTPPNGETSLPAEPARKDWLYPAGQAWKCRQKVTSEAVAKVDAIRDEAMARGWSEARLYQNQGRFRFPCGENYGLVCFVYGSRRIGEITTRYIEIISETAGRENRLRFFNPDVDQPWLKRKQEDQ